MILGFLGLVMSEKNATDCLFQSDRFFLSGRKKSELLVWVWMIMGSKNNLVFLLSVN